MFRFAVLFLAVTSVTWVSSLVADDALDLAVVRSTGKHPIYPAAYAIEPVCRALNDRRNWSYLAVCKTVRSVLQK